VGIIIIIINVIGDI